MALLMTVSFIVDLQIPFDAKVVVFGVFKRVHAYHQLAENYSCRPNVSFLGVFEWRIVWNAEVRVVVLVDNLWGDIERCSSHLLNVSDFLETLSLSLVQLGKEPKVDKLHLAAASHILRKKNFRWIFWWLDIVEVQHDVAGLKIQVNELVVLQSLKCTHYLNKNVSALV